MAKVLNVQQFVADQTQLHKDRRVSQYIYFLDKSPAFPLYYAINTIKSTTELSTYTIDQYIGIDSPVRYDKIKNLPIYGMPQITTESEFSDLLGTNSESYRGEAIVVPGIIEPTEGSCFILTYFNSTVLFMIDEVTEIALKARPHFRIQYHIESADKIPQLERQVVSNNTAIFDNVGTENRVILEDSVFNQVEQLKNTYVNIHDYYMKKFMNRSTTTFETKVMLGDNRIRFVDRFLEMFMTNVRVLVMDNMVKSIFMLDNNQLYTGGEYDIYEKSLFYAIQNKTTELLDATTHIGLFVLNSPFSLFRLQTHDSLYVTDEYMNTTDINYSIANSIEFDINPVLAKISANDVTVTTDIDRIYSIIVKYFNGGELTMSDFTDIAFLNIGDLDKYYWLPIVMYILSLHINVLEKDIANTYKLSPTI